jgi:porphobilinogen synthase
LTNLLHRPRRLRKSATLRSLVRETHLSSADFVLPFFVCTGTNVRREVSSMPGVFNLSVDEVTKEASQAFDSGVKERHTFWTSRD